MTVKSENLKRQLTGAHMTRSEQSAADALAIALEQGARAMPRNQRYDDITGTGRLDGHRSVIAGLNSTLSLRSMLPDLIDRDGFVNRLPSVTPAGEHSTLQTAILENSRTMQAGSNLIVLPEETLASTDAGPVLIKRPSGLVEIEPAPFAPVADDEDVSESSMPTNMMEIDREAGQTYGFRTVLKRSEIRQRGFDVLASELLVSITAGLARAADKHLLTAVAAAAPGTFSLAEAAAAGCRFDQLRAIVGTAGTGADVGQDGVLRAAGVPAELSGDVAGTYAADWGCTGVAAHDAIDMLVERTSANGSVTVTCWLTLHSLVGGKVWEIA